MKRNRIIIGFVAVFAALALVFSGGAAQAAKWITGKDVKNGSLTSADYRDGSVKKRDLSDWVQKRLDRKNKGVVGHDGSDGKNGTNGEDGADGTNGTNGEDGADGADGTNGTNGTDGADGVTNQYVTNRTVSVPANSTVTFARQCDKIPGTYAIGGGVTFDAGTDPVLANSPNDHDVTTVASGPASLVKVSGRNVATEWQVTVKNADDEGHAVLVYAVCAS